MLALSDTEVARRLSRMPEWRLQGNAISRIFAFPDFVIALGFVNRVAEAAESAGHHPDIDIRYNRVMLSLSTHDAGGITEKDFELASQIDRLSD